MIYEHSYETLSGCHCLYSCFYNYLNYKKIPISELDFFLTGKGYELIQDDKGNYVYKIMADNRVLLEDLGIPCEVKQIQENEKALEVLETLITQETCLILFVAPQFLTYNMAFAQAVHAGHCINVIGIRDKKEILVSDGYIAGFKKSSFQDWVSLDEIIKSWKEAGFFYLIVKLDDMQGCEKGKQYDLKHDLSGYKQSNAVHTEYAISLIEKNKTEAKEVIAARMAELNEYIRFSGPLFVRNYFLELIKKIPDGDAFLSAYLDVIKKWSVISCMLIKQSFMPDSEKLANIVTEMRNALNAETAVLDNLYSRI